MKIYTKTGDKGETSLIGGQRVSKAHPRLESYGTIDELNSYLGMCLAAIKSSPAKKLSSSSLVSSLGKVQHRLFNIGSLLACEDPKIAAGLPAVSREDISELEKEIDAMTADLTPLRRFILPGGAASAAHLHVARTIARRAERSIVSLHPEGGVSSQVIEFINRLSDFLFVAARWANATEGQADIPWEKEL